MDERDCTCRRYFIQSQMSTEGDFTYIDHFQICKWPTTSSSDENVSILIFSVYPLVSVHLQCALMLLELTLVEFHFLWKELNTLSTACAIQNSAFSFLQGTITIQ